MNKEDSRMRCWSMPVCKIAILVLAVLCAVDRAQAQSQWTTNGSNINNTNTGNVGIGTPTPAHKLDVVGNINAGGALCLQGDCKFTWSQVVGTPNQWLNGIGGAKIYYLGGNVGIGTNNPVKMLHVSGANSQILIDRTANTAGNYALLNFGTGGLGKFLLGLNSDAGTGVDKLSFFETAFSSSTPVMTLTGGNVGIGTLTPGSKFHVAGQIQSSTGGFKFPDGSVQLTAAIGGGGTISGVTAGAGLTGGGTSGAVTLTNNDRGSTQSIFKNIADAAGATKFSAGANNDSIRFAGIGGTAVTFDAAAKKVTIDATGSTASAANISSGQFGQNTGGGNYTFPGSLTVNGNIAAKYQDVAEWVPASHAMSAGTVVVLDSTKSNHVTASTEAYDSRVAGVISLQPGLTLGEEALGRVLVATTGRVRVKVDASNGPIQIGDLLVTSDKTGIAMKSVGVEVGGVRIHRPGTLIGKALEPLAKGTGEILVLLSLQ